MEDRFAASMLGLALGDAMGSRYEGGPAGRAAAWPGREPLRWTDDTQMAMGLAESLIEKRAVDPDHLAKRWARKYEAWRGYAGGARRLLEIVRQGGDWREANRSVFPDGSFGNGAAMRAAPLGLFFHRTPDALVRGAEQASAVTHAHPLGIEGGVLIARATSLALADPFEPARFLETLRSEAGDPVYAAKLDRAREWLGENPSIDQIQNRLGNSVFAHESAVTAVFAFCQVPADFVKMM